MMRAIMMMAMIRATYYVTCDTVIQFYFIVYAHNASFILELYSQPIGPAIPAAYLHKQVWLEDRQTDRTDGRTMDFP
jgi:hypothetical protein